MSDHPLDEVISQLDVLVKALESLEKDLSKFQWIDVNEETPTPFEDVLLSANGVVAMGWNEATDSEDPAYCSFHAIDLDEISHWMPLPKPPEGE